MEPKTIPPALRTKKRYIVYRIISEKPVEFKDFVEALWNSSFALFGESGTSETKMWNIANLYDDKNQSGVIKCEHISVEKMRAAISAVQVVGEIRAAVKVIGVTGTLKNAQLKYLGDDKDGI